MKKNTEISAVEIAHLGTLARIALTDEEIHQLQTEVSSILDYISSINELVAEADLTKVVGPVHNVFREDTVTNPNGTYTDALTEAFPDRARAHLKVKKILNPEQ